MSTLIYSLSPFDGAICGLWYFSTFWKFSWSLASRVSLALERGPGNPAEKGTQLLGAEEGNRAQQRYGR